MNEKHSIYTLTITTPDGVIEVPIQHSAANENDDTMHITIVVTIQGNKMCFDAETTEEVLTKFANLCQLAGAFSLACLVATVNFVPQEILTMNCFV